MRSAPFSRAVRRCDHAADGKAVPVLHERMAQISKLGLVPVRLTVELGFRVGQALMRIVLADLAVKVRAVIVLLGLLRLEAFVRCPGFDQRAINREVLVRQEAVHLRGVETGHELLEHVAFFKAFPVLGEHGESQITSSGERPTNQRNSRS